jgi:uncharacterized protein (DUF1810 family)
MLIDRGEHPCQGLTMSVNDDYDLQRFVRAQNGCFDRVCNELSAGRKQSHWMWFIFPQLKGLGSSSMAVRYAIASKEEGQAYLSNSILGPRLRHCTELVLRVQGRSIKQIFGSPDDLKFRSSMTLFSNVTPENKVFQDALQKYFAGQPDLLTIARL